MSAPAFDPGAVLALAGIFALVGAALAVARSRSLLAFALMIAVFSAAAAAALVGLDAPDVALVEALFGVGLLPTCLIGAMLLTAPSVKPRAKRIRIGALVSACAVAGALALAAPDLAMPGAGAHADAGRIYVSRAWGETGVRSGLAAVAGNYHALDTLAQLGALAGAALGVLALLGFGERAGGRLAAKEEAR